MNVVLEWLAASWSDFLSVLPTVLVSLAVLAIATLVQVTLKIAARSNGTASAPVDVVTWEDAVFWIDWTTNILVAFIVLAIQANGELGSLQIGTLIICLYAGGMVVPQFVRWYCSDPATGNITSNGMKLSNSASGVVILCALFAGVNLFK